MPQSEYSAALRWIYLKPTGNQRKLEASPPSKTRPAPEGGLTGFAPTSHTTTAFAIHARSEHLKKVDAPRSQLPAVTQPSTTAALSNIATPQVLASQRSEGSNGIRRKGATQDQVHRIQKVYVICWKKGESSETTPVILDVEIVKSAPVKQPQIAVTLQSTFYVRTVSSHSEKLSY